MLTEDARPRLPSIRRSATLRGAAIQTRVQMSTRSVVLVGPQGVGKTTLAHALAGLPLGDTRPTIGADIETLASGGSLYDVAGTDDMVEPAAKLARTATHIIVAFSIADADSFNAALRTWAQVATGTATMTPAPRRLLVGLQADRARAVVDARIDAKALGLDYLEARRGDVADVATWIYDDDDADDAATETASLLGEGAVPMSRAAAALVALEGSSKGCCSVS
jgi:hypothetical protein